MDEHLQGSKKVKPIEQWLKRVEKIVGFALEGTQDIDGYSLHAAMLLHEAGYTAQQTARIFTITKPSLKNLEKMIARGFLQ